MNKLEIFQEAYGKEYVFTETELIKLMKIAELIVKECARVADLADENACEWIGGNVLTHFGIKL